MKINLTPKANNGKIAIFADIFPDKQENIHLIAGPIKFTAKEPFTQDNPCDGPLVSISKEDAIEFAESILAEVKNCKGEIE